MNNKPFNECPMNTYEGPIIPTKSLIKNGPTFPKAPRHYNYYSSQTKIQSRPKIDPTKNNSDGVKSCFNYMNIFHNNKKGIVRNPNKNNSIITNNCLQWK